MNDPMRAASYVLPVLLLGVDSIAQGTPTAITPLPGPVFRSIDRSAHDFAYAGRIVDALTSRPIPGAVLYQVPERSRPTGGEFWFDAKWIADADGFVRVLASELRGGSWFVADAQGYGPIAAMSSPPGDDGMIRLVPGIDFPVAVHDALDRPVAGVEVGACLGCGHNPDVRTATTDARGIAVLRCVQPTNRVPGYHIFDVYPRGEGLAADYEEQSWGLGEPPVVMRQPSAATSRGRVLAPNGAAMRGVAVRADTGLHRGPWTSTDAEGRFTLLGNPTNGVDLFLDDREFVAWLPATQRAIDLVLPAEPVRLQRKMQWLSPQQAPMPTAGTGKVVVTVKDAASGGPLQDAHVELWRVGIQTQSEDWQRAGATDEHGGFTAHMSPGAVALRVTGPPAGDDRGPPTHEAEVRDVEVRAEGELAVGIALTPRTPVSVHVADGVRGVSLVTLSPGEAHDINALIAIGKPVPVPVREPFAFRVDSERERGVRYVRFDVPPTAPIELRPFPPTHVQLRIVDAQGKPTPAVVSLGDAHSADFADEDEDEPPPQPNTEADGACALQTELSGIAVVTVRPTLPGHRTLRARVSLPACADDARIDLGTFALPAVTAPRLRVLGADGTPARGQLTLLRPGLQTSGPLATDGGWDGLAPIAGDRVHVRFAEPERGEADAAVTGILLPLTVQLTGDGPWSLRQGSGTIVFDVQDDFALRPDAGAIVFEDQLFPVAGRLELRGLPDRDLEFFVGADGCDSARVRLRLAPNEQRRVDVVLKRRP